MTLYPGAKDTFVNPQSTDTMDSETVPHDVQHANLNDAVAALQNRVGITASADATSLDYQVNQLLQAIFNLNGNGTMRFKNGQLQFWDTGYAANTPSTPWAAVICNNGVINLSAPIAT
jgi:hypothetical protein